MAHQIDATEIETLDFSIHDADNMPIDDMAMIYQWKQDSSFKVIIDLKVSRRKIDLVTEVLIPRSYFYTSLFIQYISLFLFIEFAKFLDKAKRRQHS